jgi:hypothetical protein
MPLLLLPGGECELKAVGSESAGGGQQLALKSGAFESSAEALAAGQRATAGLLLSSLRQGYGVSINARVAGGGVTANGKKWLAQDRFDTVLDDTYGLVVFQDIGRVGFVSVGEAEARITGPVARFAEAMSTGIADAIRWDERLLVSYDLYANSRFENSSRARFLLLIMAVEALAEQSARTEPEIVLIDGLLKIVAKAGLPAQQREALVSGIGKLKRVSIGYACRTYLASAVSSTCVSDQGAPEYFAECYRIRGRVVHGGASPNARELANYSAMLEPTVRELLMAHIDGRGA